MWGNTRSLRFCSAQAHLCFPKVFKAPCGHQGSTFQGSCCHQCVSEKLALIFQPFTIYLLVCSLFHLYGSAYLYSSNTARLLLLVFYLACILMFSISLLFVSDEWRPTYCHIVDVLQLLTQSLNQHAFLSLCQRQWRFKQYVFIIYCYFLSVARHFVENSRKIYVFTTTKTTLKCNFSNVKVYLQCLFIYFSYFCFLQTWLT